MELHHTYFFLGQGVTVLLTLLIFYFYLANCRPKLWRSIRVMTFLVSYITLFAVFAILLFERFTYGIYLVPFAAVPIVVMVFFDTRTGVMALLATVLIAAMVATFQYQFIFLEITAGLASTFCLRQLSKRSQLLWRPSWPLSHTAWHTSPYSLWRAATSRPSRHAPSA